MWGPMHAFQTDSEKFACIVIDLKKQYHITQVVIENVRTFGRSDADELMKRSTGLKVLLSNRTPDRNVQVWQAKTVEKKWEIPVARSIRSQYVVIGVENSILHLAHVWVYGY